MKENGALYRKGLIPFVSNVVVDGRHVAGQNPDSAKATAVAVVKVVGKFERQLFDPAIRKLTVRKRPINGPSACRS